MIDEKARIEEQVGFVGRLTESLLKRRFGYFAAELALVIAGVLIALAVDGWISDSRDRATEFVYLELLARDVDGIRREIDLQIEFEKEKIDTAARAYEALTFADPRSNRAEIGSSLALLASRRTLTLRSATYDQMVSSGHLQLIENYELRDGIVRFFAEMERNQRIADNNNRQIVDDVFIPFVMRAGITPLQRPETSQVTLSLNRANAILYEHLGPEFRPPEDRVLLQPAEADSWNDIRRNVLLRMRISATGQALAEAAAERTQVVAAAIAAELDDR